jgi:hypothetical protein
VNAKPIILQLPTGAVLGALLVLALLLLLPGRAAAQNDAIRVMAERVLGGSGFPGMPGRDRNDGVRRDRDDDRRYENDRRDDERWRRAQKAREKYCRKNPRARDCRDSWEYGRGNGQDRRNDNASWCWDRNGDRRCDVSPVGRRGRTW